MTFDAKETSLQDAQPNEIYDFSMGPDTWRYTSGEDDVVIESFIYTAIEMRRSSLLTDTNERNENLNIVMPAELPLPSVFRHIVPGQVATVVVRRYHRTDTAEELSVVYVGAINTVSFISGGLKASLNCKTLSTQMTSQVPTRTYQSSCNFVLFDTGCGIASGSHRWVGNVGTVSGNTLTVPGLTASKGNGWATGGYISYGGLDYRFVIYQSSDTIRLLLPFPGSMAGEQIEVYAGCAHTIGVCSSKFGNVTRFGGCAWVPTKNIFAVGID